MPAPTSGGTDSRYSAKPKIASHIGHEGDEQRGDAGRDRLLAPRDEPGPADEEQRADDRRVAELDSRGLGRSGAAVPAR